ncbi:hypothetical protein EP331_06200 [bacterium]|nr:MAG: hypothetical protein EP331_06200 [bacterium]
MKKAFTLFMCAFSLTSVLKGQTQSVKVGDELRRFTLFAPKSISKEKPSSLVINFHGTGMTALEHMFYTEMNKTASKNSFIIVYPQGKNNDWNVGLGQEYYEGTDVAFIDSLVKKIKKEYTITQVYGIGFSRGGFFVQRLVAEFPDLFTAVASISAPITNKAAQQMPKTVNVGFMLVQGDQDKAVLHTGIQGAYYSDEACIQFWLDRNNLGMNYKETVYDKKYDGTKIIRKSYVGSPKIEWLAIENGGHTWPGSDDFNVGFNLGKTTHQLNFNQTVWDFFSKQRRTK